VERAAVLELGPGRRALAASVETDTEIAAALEALGLGAPRPVLVVVGGAAGLTETVLLDCAACADDLVAAAAVRGGAIVDGGTDAGVMRLLGRAHVRARADVPLVGVVVGELAAFPGREAAPDAVSPEPEHTHFVLVPGSTWGDEAPWLARVADELAGDRPSATVLLNGGEIAWRDVEESIAAGRRVLAVTGTGRTADALAAAVAGSPTEARAAVLVRSGLVEAVGLGEDARPSLKARVEQILGADRDDDAP
jgi:hypothetical protein